MRWRIHASALEALSLMVSESAATQLSVMIFDQQGLCAQTNPGFTCGGSLVDCFWVGSDSVFARDFAVYRVSLRWRIQTSALEADSLIISKSSATQYSVTSNESARSVCADESKHQLRNQFRWRFQMHERLSFRCWFPSQLGLCALTNPGVSCEKSLGDGLWVFNYSVFGDDYWLNRDCVHRQNRGLAGEGVSVMISEPRATHFWVAIFESSGTMCADESRCHLGKQCRWWFLLSFLLLYPSQ